MNKARSSVAKPSIRVSDTVNELSNDFCVIIFFQTILNFGLLSTETIEVLTATKRLLKNTEKLS